MQKETRRKILSLLLSLAMILTALPLAGVTAFAEDETHTSGDFEYTILEDGTASVVSYLGDSKIVNIPQMLDGCTVTEIGEFFCAVSDITEVIMPDSITTIGNLALSNCSELEKVTFSKNLKTIVLGALGLCPKLKSVTLPKSVERIDSQCFGYIFTEKPGNRPGIPTLDIIEDFTVYGHAGTVAQNYAESIGCTFVDISQSDTTEPPFIWKCTNNGNDSVSIVGFLGELDNQLVLPKDIMGHSVTGIGKNAFSDCKDMTNIIIPYGIKNIDKLAFSGCSSLKEIWIPNSVTELGNYVFNECENLETVVIGNGVTEIADHTFRNCNKLVKIILHSNISKINDMSLGTYRVLTYGYSGSYAESFQKTSAYGNHRFFVLPTITEDNQIVRYYEYYNDETYVEDIIFSLYITKNIELPTVTVKDKNGNLITDYTQGIDLGMEFSAELSNSNGEKIVLKLLPCETHSWYSDVMVIQEPTCENKGLGELTCSVCGYNTSTAISATGHTEVIDEAIDPTCTTTGKTEGSHCSVCAKILVEQKEIPIKEHTWSEWETEGETKTRVCEVCGKREYEELNNNSSSSDDATNSDNPLINTNIKGDVNEDGKVTVVDAKWILQHISGTRQLTEKQQKAADLNADGKITVVDAKWVLQIVSGLRKG